MLEHDETEPNNGPSSTPGQQDDEQYTYVSPREAVDYIEAGYLEQEARDKKALLE